MFKITLRVLSPIKRFSFLQQGRKEKLSQRLKIIEIIFNNYSPDETSDASMDFWLSDYVKY